MFFHAYCLMQFVIVISYGLFAKLNFIYAWPDEGTNERANSIGCVCPYSQVLFVLYRHKHMLDFHFPWIVCSLLFHYVCQRVHRVHDSRAQFLSDHLFNKWTIFPFVQFTFNTRVNRTMMVSIWVGVYEFLFSFLLHLILMAIECTNAHTHTSLPMNCMNRTLNYMIWMECEYECTWANLTCKL